MPRSIRRAVLGVLGILAAAVVVVAADWWIALPEGETADYVGRATCARCHPKETELWTGSDHDRAMDTATPQTVLGNFDQQMLTHFGVTSTMSRRGDQFFVTTENRQGKPETFPVKYVFGVRPLQQYLVEFPDGRVQCLPVAWDTEQKRWFHLYPDERIPPGDPLHWTRPLQNWNYMCAECHSTNLQKNYRVADNTYHTTWSEIDVSCETCHGPGSLHVKLADSRRLFWDRRYGYGLPRLKDTDSRVEIQACAPCHARRRIVAPDFRPGNKLLDHYMVEILDNELYYPDGQIREEDYEYSSFIQSKMYHKNVRCSNCHDPHTARIKFLEPSSPKVPYTDNRLCAQCHLPTKYDTPQHHHHPATDKPGGHCVDCHMPETTYMVVDPRRDHSIRIPRPDLTVALKIPNACNGCHRDASKGETAEWALQQVEKWYGKRKDQPHFAHAIAAGRQGKPEAERPLVVLAKRKDVPAIVRASAISLLSRYQTPDAVGAAVLGLEDPDELVRAVAVRSLHYLPLPERYERLSPMLSDSIRAVRTEAARLLAAVPRRVFSADRAEAFDLALAEYMAGQRAVDDQPAAHLNMAVIYVDLGQVDKADDEYQAALRIDPQFVPAKINLAMLRDQQGRKGEAESLFREVIRQEPKMGEVYYSLGLLVAEDDKRLEEATGLLAKAAELVSDNPRIHYNHGLALQKLGRPQKAEEAILAAHKLAPQNTDYLHALAILYSQQKQWDRAIASVEQLRRLEPSNPNWGRLLSEIQRLSQPDK
ncbi:MAG: tetratricopeptide repeat protein [Thermoguttaceae bacterium]